MNVKFEEGITMFYVVRGLICNSLIAYSYH